MTATHRRGPRLPWVPWLHATGVALTAALTLAAVHAGSALVWLGLLALLRISSLAGMVAAMSAPVTAALVDRFDIVLPLLAFALIVLWKHGANIERLLEGSEPRIGRKNG